MSSAYCVHAYVATLLDNCIRRTFNVQFYGKARDFGALHLQRQTRATRLNSLTPGPSFLVQDVALLKAIINALLMTSERNRQSQLLNGFGGDDSDRPYVFRVGFLTT